MIHHLPIVAFLAASVSGPVAAQRQVATRIGREVAIPRHLQDGEEYRLSIPQLIAFGRKLFCANWTWQEGGGRPLTKGTGRPLSDPKNPLTGLRAFNRIWPRRQFLRRLP